MLPLLRAVELDLVVEQAGHRASVKGSDGQFIVDFPTLRSLVHFGRELWPHRQQAPPGVAVSLSWRGFKLRVLRDSSR